MSKSKLMSAQPSRATAKNTKVVVKNATVRLPFKEREGGVFTAMTANQTIKEAKKIPNPRKLWKEFWFENEVCCLFADTNVGKTILAVQIATSIAETDRVLYYDFEQSSKQFQMRYTDEKTQKAYKFPNNLIRLCLSTEELIAMGDRMEDMIIASIEGDVKAYEAKFVVIDNISYLLNVNNSQKTASILMKRLVDLKKRLGLSILVIAHTPKRNMTKPLGQNDLAGSKRLINFFDAAFAIGKSTTDPNIKYLKQIKVRTGKIVYDENNVLLCTVEQKNSFLQFVEMGCGDEADHLQKPKAQDREQKKQLVKELTAKGMSTRDIERETGIPHATAQRYLEAMGLSRKKSH